MLFKYLTEKQVVNRVAIHRDMLIKAPLRLVYS